MKWLSQNMVARYRGVILLFALSLIIIGLVVGNEGGTTSASIVFLIFLVLTITVVFWNLFEKNTTNDYKQISTPGVIGTYGIKSSENTEIDEVSEIPNPLDSDIDIPLM
jgi:hypothetical protein